VGPSDQSVIPAARSPCHWQCTRKQDVPLLAVGRPRGHLPFINQDPLHYFGTSFERRTEVVETACAYKRTAAVDRAEKLIPAPCTVLPTHPRVMLSGYSVSHSLSDLSRLASRSSRRANFVRHVHMLSIFSTLTNEISRGYCTILQQQHLRRDARSSATRQIYVSSHSEGQSTRKSLRRPHLQTKYMFWGPGALKPFLHTEMSKPEPLLPP
jgi:hypothetical protein